jgi:hypothetical protein
MNSKYIRLQEKYLKQMQDCVGNYDTEAAHWDADMLLCELLTELGFVDLVDKYGEVDKWFA